MSSDRFYVAVEIKRDGEPANKFLMCTSPDGGHVLDRREPFSYKDAVLFSEHFAIERALAACFAQLMGVENHKTIQHVAVFIRRTDVGSDVSNVEDDGTYVGPDATGMMQPERGKAPSCHIIQWNNVSERNPWFLKTEGDNSYWVRKIYNATMFSHPDIALAARGDWINRHIKNFSGTELLRKVLVHTMPIIKIPYGDIDLFVQETEPAIK